MLASSGIWCVFYFLGAIFFCSFYLLNLVLAVVALSYELEIKSVSKEVTKDLNLSLNTVQILDKVGRAKPLSLSDHGLN